MKNLKNKINILIYLLICSAVILVMIMTYQNTLTKVKNDVVQTYTSITPDAMDIALKRKIEIELGDRYDVVIQGRDGDYYLFVARLITDEYADGLTTSLEQQIGWYQEITNDITIVYSLTAQPITVITYTSGSEEIIYSTDSAKVSRYAIKVIKK